jgi:hypothetical protein
MPVLFALGLLDALLHPGQLFAQLVTVVFQALPFLVRGKKPPESEAASTSATSRRGKRNTCTSHVFRYTHLQHLLYIKLVN